MHIREREGMFILRDEKVHSDVSKCWIKELDFLSMRDRSVERVHNVTLDPSDT